MTSIKSRLKKVSFSRLGTFWATPSLIVASLVVTAVPSKATNVKIKCDTQTQIPTVVAQKSEQQVPILKFLPKYFAAQTALANCQHTAQTLQKQLQQSSYSYLTSEVIDGQSVVCTVERRGKGCQSPQSQILFTLAAETSPDRTMYELLGNQFKSSEPSNSRTVSRIYTKIDRAWWDFWRF